MSQKLCLPLDDMRLTAAYKNAQYKAYWGFHHYGLDCVSSDTQVYACGNGTVLACGQDGVTLHGDGARLGNVIVILYPGVEYHNGTVSDLVCRMYHFDDINVKIGDNVTKSTIIGKYGSTGKYTSGPHLHIEFDTDIRWPSYAFGVASGGKIIKAGTVDSSVNPSRVWYLGEGQKIRGAANGWYGPDDLKIPNLVQENPTIDYQDLYQKEKIRADHAQVQTDSLIRKQNELIANLKSLINEYQ